MMNAFKLALSGAVIAMTIAGGTMAASAEQAIPSRVRGTITAVSPDSLEVHTRDGKDVQVALTKETSVAAIELTTLDAIKPDSYIGTAAAPQPDGSLKALEVHIFPASMRGAGEGTRPWDLTPNSTMTNGAVGSIVGSDGRTLTVKYQNGEKKVFVPADVPIVSIVPADRTLLKAGVKAVLLATKNADGSLVARSVSVGTNGAAPPM
ncbi:hypothetical protein F0357_01940 [Rhizobiales bacterium Sp-1]|uniref:Uncharacterized protein n=2 Tax=Segnochrobactrum spirostomi TaxID=2608987 RepID=A0A6A7XXR2_9HYPH|nr:hypothetical protein [Segnochrobactrum spirostomi]